MKDRSTDDPTNHKPYGDFLKIVQQGVQMALEEKDLTTITDSTDTKIKETANSVTSDITMQTMQQQMDMMKKMFEAMQTMQTTGNHSRKNRRNPYQYTNTVGYMDYVVTMGHSVVPRQMDI